MKILFISYKNPNFDNTSFYREEALVSLGNEVVYLNEQDYFLPGRVRQTFPYLQAWDNKRLNDKIVRSAERSRPDLCLVVGGYTISEDVLKKMKETGIKLFLRTTNVPLDFSNIIRTAPLYDQIFCAGTEALTVLRNEAGVNARWMPYAAEPSKHKQVDVNALDKKAYKRDIVFVGSFYPNRAEVLSGLSDLDLGIWGPNWRLLGLGSPLKEKAVDRRLNYTEWIKIYSLAKIVVVAHYHDGKTPCDQASPKLFEALSCGSFVLVDKQKDAMSLFEDGKHVVYFEGSADLREKANYYLGHPEQREMIAEAGREEVLRKHTYKDRMTEILGFMGGE